MLFDVIGTATLGVVTRFHEFGISTPVLRIEIGL